MSKNNKKKKQKREEKIQIPEVPVAKLEVTKEDEFTTEKMHVVYSGIIVGLILILCTTVAVCFPKMRHENKENQRLRQKLEEVEELNDSKSDFRSFLSSQKRLKEIHSSKIADEEVPFLVFTSLPANARATEEEAKEAGALYCMTEKEIGEKVFLKFDKNWKIRVKSYGNEIDLVPYEDLYFFKLKYGSTKSEYLVEITDLMEEENYYFYIYI